MINIELITDKKRPEKRKKKSVNNIEIQSSKNWPLWLYWALLWILVIIIAIPAKKIYEIDIIINFWKFLGFNFIAVPFFPHLFLLVIVPYNFLWILGWGFISAELLIEDGKKINPYLWIFKTIIFIFIIEISVFINIIPIIIWIIISDILEERSRYRLRI